MAQPASHIVAEPDAPSCGDAFVQAAEQALASGDFSRISDAEIERVMTAATRLYAAKSDATGATPQPVTPERVTPTDVVVVVSEMIRAAGLNLWDLSMWYRRRG
jgi:hypothetical protein